MKTKLGLTLQRGDTIGIASPSHIVTDARYEPIFRGIEEHGFRVKKAKNLYANTYGYSATEQERADDINELVSDDNVKMILFGGGEGAIELLPYIDFENIKKHPKIFLSYSDGTSLLHTIYAKTGLITYYGQDPSLFATVSDYNDQQFIDFCMTGDVKEMKHNSEWRTLSHGIGAGTLIGGYLTNFALLLGTDEYKLDYNQDYVLFLEDHEMFFGVPYLSAILAFIEQSKLMPHVRGLLFGNYCDEGNQDLFARLARLGKKWNIPVCYCDDFGHGTNHAILGIGCQVILDANNQKLIYK